MFFPRLCLPYDMYVSSMICMFLLWYVCFTYDKGFSYAMYVSRFSYDLYVFPMIMFLIWYVCFSYDMCVSPIICMFLLWYVWFSYAWYVCLILLWYVWLSYDMYVPHMIYIFLIGSLMACMFLLWYICFSYNM